MELPDWLRPTDHEVSIQDQRFPQTNEHKEMTRILYESLFERVLDALESGEDYSHVVDSDPRPINKNKFRSWVRNDPERLRLFEEAEQNGTRVLEDRMLSAAKGGETLEDVQRSKLYVDTLKYVLQIRNKRRYGTEKDTGSQNGTININITGVESPYQITNGITIDG